jgi:hypothetical protein
MKVLHLITPSLEASAQRVSATTGAFCCDGFLHCRCSLHREVAVADEQCMDGQGGEGFCSFMADVFVNKKLLESILDIDTLKNRGAKT